MALRIPAELVGDKQVDIVFQDTAPLDTFHTWRKHPNLHGWMEALYRKKGGKQCFNVTPLRLMPEDLDQLESDINSTSLPPTAGFFFGRSDGSERADDLDFIAKARAAIKVGYAVFYNSWW